MDASTVVALLVLGGIVGLQLVVFLRRGTRNGGCCADDHRKTARGGILGSCGTPVEAGARMAGVKKAAYPSV